MAAPTQHGEIRAIERCGMHPHKDLVRPRCGLQVICENGAVSA